MLSINRTILFCIGALAFIHANDCAAKIQADIPQVQNSTSQNRPAVSASIRGPVEGLGHKPLPPRCGPRKYADASELCAQWLAADAAADSAWWAWVSGLVGLFSLIGVFGAIALAYRGNRIARQSMHAQNRAWLSVGPPKMEHFRGVLNGVESGEGGMILQCRIINNGTTPALNAVVAVDFDIIHEDDVPRLYEWPENYEGGHAGVVHPSDETVSPPKPLTGDQIGGLIGGRTRIALYIIVKYNDIFSKEIRTTQSTQSITLHHALHDGQEVVGMMTHISRHGNTAD